MELGSGNGQQPTLQGIGGVHTLCLKGAFQRFRDENPPGCHTDGIPETKSRSLPEAPATADSPKAFGIIYRGRGGTYWSPGPAGTREHIVGPGLSGVGEDAKWHGLGTLPKAADLPLKVQRALLSPAW